VATVRVKSKPPRVDVVVAPVGEQPAAVLAPLLTLHDELGLEQIVLVRSAETVPETEAISQRLPVKPGVIGDDETGSLAELPPSLRRCLLINGGQWRTVEGCRNALFAEQEPCYASSRDHVLWLLTAR
jgi:hypothetical protein